MTIRALGKHYFGDNEVPLTVRRIDERAGTHHEHDLTEVLHDHDFCELVLVVQGHGTHCVDDDTYPLQAGDVFLIQGFRRHCYRDRRNLVFYNIMYNPETLGLPADRLNAIPGYQAMFVLEPAYRRRHQFSSRLRLGRLELAQAEALARQIQEECGNREPGWEVAAIARLQELIVFLARQYSRTGTESGQALLRVAAVIGCIETDYAKAWTLPRLADFARMSESSLSHVFKEATGHPPIDYLIRVRVQRAMTLLRESSLPISSVADRVGFSDSNYFTRQFRRIAGTTPRDFRCTGQVGKFVGN
jgi:AraC-like DNA-binding protein